jgi:crotonobetainyl-CoA:carnitine CoA-transferase CaiB-like acyl-CoA transferase
MLLADMGADVIKVEPLSGGFMREAMDGAFYVTANRNKRAIALDLKSNEGKAIALKLVREADVVVENFVPGVMDKLGLGYKAVRQLNSRIVYCSISGYGQEGPYSRRPGLDPIAQAVSGIMLILGEPDRPPARIPLSMIDYGAGLHAAYGILVALLNRDRTGEGQYLDVSLLDVGLAQMSIFIAHYTITGEVPKRMGSAHRAYAPYQAFEAKDGWVMICIANDEAWNNLCKALNLGNLFDDPRFRTVEQRLKHRDQVVNAVGEAVRRYEARELEAVLNDVGVPCGKLRTVKEVIEDEHIRRRKILEDAEYPQIGKFKAVKTPIFFDGEGSPIRIMPPRIGEHTASVLTELGYSLDDIHRLEKSKIVRSIQY